MLSAAAAAVTLVPAADSAGQRLTFGEVRRQFTPLTTTLILLQDERLRLCLIASHWLGVHYYQYSNILRKRVGQVLGLPLEQVLVFGSHNHCAAALTRESRVFGQPAEDRFLEDDELTTDGRRLLSSLAEAAAGLEHQLVPVTVSWAEGRERRITHNNKGRNPDGTTYMIRHEERMRLGSGWTGDIEDRAPVVLLNSRSGRPVAALVQFTGHPTTAYHPDYAVVHGEYPQIACEVLAEALGGVPVAFFQGCAADSYSVGSFSGAAPEELAGLAERNGHLLGETYAAAAADSEPSIRSGIDLAWERVVLPFAEPPALDEVRAMIAEIDGYIERCRRGEEDTLRCVGLNASPTFSLNHRIGLVEPVRRWAGWIEALHREGRISEAPEALISPAAAFRIGDVGFGGLACEPFMGIGRLIRSASPFPLTIPCGYLNDTSVVNIPDSANNGDLDFMSSTYRYTVTMLPYRQPAGDLLAEAAAGMLRRMA